jgi:uncharacterized protein YxjI
MHNILNRNHFFIKEHVGAFKAANNFDILDPETQDLLMTCREEKLGFLTKVLRFSSDYKTFTPFEIDVHTADGQPILTVKRGVTFLKSTVDVLDGQGRLVGRLKQKLLSIGGKFSVEDPEGRPVCTLQGKWTSWDFKFIKDERVLASVTKKWDGLAKELFTTADNYMLIINDSVPADNSKRLLILAAVLCIDMVLKE